MSSLLTEKRQIYNYGNTWPRQLLSRRTTCTGVSLLNQTRTRGHSKYVENSRDTKSETRPSLTRKSRANMPSHTSKQCNSLEWPSEDPKGARKSRKPTEHRDDHACTRNPAGVPAAGGGRGRSTAEMTIDTPITTRWTSKSTLLDQLDPQEEGCDGARRTTKSGTEGEAKPRSSSPEFWP